MHAYANGEPNTYHITNPDPLSLGQLQEIYIRLFNLNGDIVDEEDFQRKEASRAEAMFQKASALYAPYMAAEPVFDRTNTDEVLLGSDIELPKIDKTYFDRLLGYARSVRWGKEKGEPVKSGGRLSKIRGYFDDFLNAKLNEHLLSELRSLSARFRIVLKEDPQMHWTLEVREGSLVTVSDDGMVGDCSFIVGSEPLARIVSAKVSPQEAFLNKDVEIAGDMATGLKLVTMLAEFFRKYPYDIR
jgi:putative sterol carrier protein